MPTATTARPALLARLTALHAEATALGHDDTTGCEYELVVLLADLDKRETIQAANDLGFQGVRLTTRSAAARWIFRKVFEVKRAHAANAY